MSVSNVSAATTGDLEVGVCGNCDARNAAEAKFCGRCGQPLQETCGRCQQQGPLGQKFCAGCGHHLQDELQQSLEQIARTLDDADRALADYDFERASALAHKHLRSRDFRFDATAARAQAILQQAQQATAMWRQRVEAAEQQARAAADRGDDATVLEAVQDIPEKLLADDLRSVVVASSAALAELKRLRAETKRAVAAKDYMAAGVLLNQLLQLRPNSEVHRKHAAVVAEQLCRQAHQHFAAGRFARAVQSLEAVPLAAQQSVRYLQLLRQVNTVAWMIDQISNEPLLTPVLLGICRRMSERLPEDRRTAHVVQRVREQRKLGSRDPRCPFPVWNDQPVGWRSAPVSILAQPQSIQLDAQGVMQKHHGRFTVALGLALQGCGGAKFDLSLGGALREGKLTKLFRRKQVNHCWGLDAGSTACRAVLLRQDGSRWVVERAWQSDYREPLCRPTVGLGASRERREMLQKFIEQCQPRDTPVWVNLSGREIVGRFFQLPPVADKALTPLLEKEISRQLPNMGADLVVRHWLGPARATGGGPLAAVVAAKRSAVQQTLETFNELGIQPAGVQCEPLALANLLAHEFADALVDGESTDERGYALVDVGAQSTTLVALTRHSLWFRAFDGGGEDLTAKIARQLKVSLEQAERLKREPWQTDDPAVLSGAMEPAMQAMGMRLEAAYQQTRLASENAVLQAVYAVGGSAETLGWLRHALHCVRQASAPTPSQP